MRSDGIRLHRSESAGTDMQREFPALNAFFAQSGKQIVGKMKPGGWRRNRTLDVRINSLIVR